MKTEILVRSLEAGVLLQIRGPLGKEGGEALLRRVEEQPATPRLLVLNFTEVGIVNTAGIGGVLWAVRLVAKAGGRSVVFGLSDHLQKIFHVMGVTNYLAIVADEASALGERP